MFDRLKKRVGISEKPVSPSVLRDTFAVRYLQVGGELEALLDLLGLTNVAVLKREEYQSRTMTTPHPSGRRTQKTFRQTTFEGNGYTNLTSG